MFLFLQTTVVRWVVEIAVQQLVMQLIGHATAKFGPAQQLAKGSEEVPLLCRQCGRSIERDTPYVRKRRSPVRKRPAKALAAA